MEQRTNIINVDPVIASNDDYIIHISSKLAEIEKLSRSEIEVIGIMDSKL